MLPLLLTLYLLLLLDKPVGRHLGLLLLLLLGLLLLLLRGRGDYLDWTCSEGIHHVLSRLLRLSDGVLLTSSQRATVITDTLNYPIL